MALNEPIHWTDAPVARPRAANTIGPTAAPTGLAAPSSRRRDTLLPHTLSGVFDEAFDLYKRHFLVFAVIVAVLFVPTQIMLHGLQNVWLLPLQTRVEAHNGSNEQATINAVVLFFGEIGVGDPRDGVPGLVGLAALAFVSGPLAVALRDIYAGREATVWAAYRESWKAFPRLVFAWLMVGMAAIAVAFGGFIVAAMVIGTVVSVLAQLQELSIVGVIFALTLPYLAVCALIAQFFAFTSPLIVLEQLPFSRISQRNRLLTTSVRFRRTWGAIISLPLVTFGLEFLILSTSGSVLETLHLPPMVNFLAEVTTSTALNFFFLPYLMIFLTTLYFDYRIRREALDIRLLSDQMPVPASPPHVEGVR